MSYYSEDGGLGGLGLLLGFILGAIILAVSVNIWIALTLNIACLFIINTYISSAFFSEFVSTALACPLILLLYILFSKNEERASWSETRNNRYREARLEALESIEKWLRNFGISSETDVKIVKRIFVENKKFAGYDDFWGLGRTPPPFNRTKPVKKSWLLPNWKYITFWYATGYAPIQTIEKIPKNSLILMTYVPENYRSNASNHRYCLVATDVTDKHTDAVLVSSANLNPSDFKDVIAVSLGPTEYALDTE